MKGGARAVAHPIGAGLLVATLRAILHDNAKRIFGL
jgi:hypothetical protein